MSNPSVLSAILKLKQLLTLQEKLKWLGIVGFAICTSFFEVVTATLIVLFAQILNDPSLGQKTLSKLKLASVFAIDLAPGRLVFFMAVMVGGIYLIKNLIAALEVFYQNFSIQKMNYHFKNKLLQCYAKTDYAFYLTRNSTLGAQVVASDAELMFSSGMIAFASILSESIIFLCLIGLVVFMNPTLALYVFVIAFVLGLTITKVLLPQFYRWGRRSQEASLFSTKNLFQFFHGFKEVILLGKRDAFVEAYQHYSFKKSRIQALQVATNALPRMVIEVLFVGIFVATIAILCLEHESPIQMIGILGGYLYAGFRLMPGLNRIISQTALFKSVIPAIERVHSEVNNAAHQENYLDLSNFEFKNSIRLQNLSFKYPNTDKNALQAITLEIKKGECLGVVGETGSGKSTLIDVILGLLRPQQGSILVDGQYPVNAYQWHQKIGYVPQSVYLIDNTIEANIAFGDKDINESNLNAAIDAAQLRKFIDQLPLGLKTIVGERGIRLSGGERQRISIARALYRNPEVLIFDEATSALDNETEAQLMETIHAVSQNRTVIMIAHRISTLKDCQVIVRMDQGRVLELTTYDKMSREMNILKDNGFSQGLKQAL